NVETHRVGDPAVREVRAAVQHRPVLARRDVGLPAGAADVHLLHVGRLCRLAAHPAAQARDALAPGAPSLALVHLRRVYLALDLDVLRALAVDVDFVAARPTSGEEPHAAGDEHAADEQHPEQRLAARAARLLDDDAVDRLFFGADLAVELGVLGER